MPDADDAVAGLAEHHISTVPLITDFLAAAAVSLVASYFLVTRIERLGARLQLTEALLGMLAALAADAPEITSSVTAMANHSAKIGAGVTIGSNVFNLVALLGLSSLVAGRIALHRRVIAFEGAVAAWIAIVCLLVILGAVPTVGGLALALVVFVPYLLVLGSQHERLTRIGLPRRAAAWLTRAVTEAEVELEEAIHPARGGRADAVQAAAATAVVVLASVVMERAAQRLGSHHHVPQIVTGGLILAGVTSIPNAVAGVYLAARGRGAATLSTAMNSNALNVIAGLLIPGAVVSLGAPTGSATLVAATYLGLTALTLIVAHRRAGLARGFGAAMIVLYAGFIAALLAVA